MRSSRIVPFLISESRALRRLACEMRGRHETHTQATNRVDVISAAVFFDLDSQSGEMGIDEMARPDSILNFDYVEEFWT